MSNPFCGSCTPCKGCTFFTDDFSADDLTNYTQVTGSWTISGGELSTASAPALLIGNTANPNSDSNTKISVDCKVANDGDTARFILVETDANNLWYGEVKVGSGGYMKIFQRVGGSDTELSTSSLNQNSSEYFHVCISISNGNRLFFSISNELHVFNLISPGTFTAIGWGLGAGDSNTGTVYFDNLTVNIVTNTCPQCDFGCSNCPYCFSDCGALQWQITFAFTSASDVNPFCEGVVPAVINGTYCVYQYYGCGPDRPFTGRISCFDSVNTVGELCVCQWLLEITDDVGPFCGFSRIFVMIELLSAGGEAYGLAVIHGSNEVGPPICGGDLVWDSTVISSYLFGQGHVGQLDCLAPMTFSEPAFDPGTISMTGYFNTDGGTCTGTSFAIYWVRPCGSSDPTGDLFLCRPTVGEFHSGQVVTALGRCYSILGILGASSCTTTDIELAPGFCDLPDVDVCSPGCTGIPLGNAATATITISGTHKHASADAPCETYCSGFDGIYVIGLSGSYYTDVGLGCETGCSGSSVVISSSTPAACVCIHDFDVSTIIIAWCVFNVSPGVSTIDVSIIYVPNTSGAGGALYTANVSEPVCGGGPFTLSRVGLGGCCDWPDTITISFTSDHVMPGYCAP